MVIATGFLLTVGYCDFMSEEFARRWNVLTNRKCGNVEFIIIIKLGNQYWASTEL